MALEQLPSIGTLAASKQGWVLVIVREPRLRQLLLMVLSRAGYALLGYATLAEARQVLTQHSAPKLILFDGSSASEESLREQVHQIEELLPSETNCRFIAFSLAHPQPRLQAVPGVDVLIAQPFDLADVLNNIEALMQAT